LEANPKRNAYVHVHAAGEDDAGVKINGFFARVPPQLPSVSNAFIFVHV
jgi:hypothetical protein